MSLATNISNLATRVATEVKAVRTLVNGNATDLSGLDTTAKSNLVLAINELKASIGSLSTELSNYEFSNDAAVAGLGSDISTINGTLTTIDGVLTDLQSQIDNLDVSGQVLALIDDTTPATDKVWSSSKTNTEISNAVAALVDGAPALLDTLNELAAAIGDDANFVTTVTNLVAGKADLVHTHAISDVTGLQTALDSKASASDLSTLTTNVGDTTTNFVTTFEAGLV